MIQTLKGRRCLIGVRGWGEAICLNQTLLIDWIISQFWSSHKAVQGGNNGISTMTKDNIHEIVYEWNVQCILIDVERNVKWPREGLRGRSFPWRQIISWWLFRAEDWIMAIRFTCCFSEWEPRGVTLKDTHNNGKALRQPLPQNQRDQGRVSPQHRERRLLSPSRCLRSVIGPTTSLVIPLL